MTILIIAMSFVLMVFMPSLLSGLITVYNQDVEDYLYGDLVIEPSGDDKYITKTEELLRKVKRIPGMTAVSSHMILSTSIVSDKKSQSVPVIAITPSDERLVTTTSGIIREGRYLSDGDTDRIFIGAAVAGHDDEVKDQIPSLGGIHTGDSVMVTFQNGVIRKMVVSGIFESGFLAADQQVFITRKEMESVLGKNDRSLSILVRTVEGIDPSGVKNRLLEFGVRGKVWLMSEKAGAVTGDVIKSFSLITTIMTIFSLIIASIVIFVIVYINTIHQRRQIGILKAVGIPELNIIRSYLLQVAFVFVAGILVGLVLFWGICEFFMEFPLRFPPGLVHLIPDMTQLYSSIIALGIVTIISGYIPAKRAAKEEILVLVNN